MSNEKTTNEEVAELAKGDSPNMAKDVAAEVKPEVTKITKLTEAQEARLPEIAQEWIEYGLNTKTDRERAESLVPDIYREGGLKAPDQILWAESPHAGYKLCKEMLDNDERPLPCYGSHDAHWLAFYAAFLEFGVKACEKLVPLMEMAKCSGWFFPMDEACILTPNPIHLSLDDEGRLHDETRKAIEYPDGWGLYYIHGVAVSERIVERPHEITIEDIENENNAEVRRIMVDRYGYNHATPDMDDAYFGVGKYILDAGAEEIHSDRWGTLYKKEQSNDEPIVTVKVKNSTAEPDGSFRHYFIRVPEDCTTAHQAVAWTFGLDTKEYSPSVET
jgi:hypothetical protein